MPVVDELSGDVFGDLGTTLNEFDGAQRLILQPPCQHDKSKGTCF